MDYSNTPDFEDYVISPEWSEDEIYSIKCTSCGQRYGSHYGGYINKGYCTYDAYINKDGNRTFVPDLPLKRPKFELPDDLFTL